MRPETDNEAAARGTRDPGRFLRPALPVVVLCLLACGPARAGSTGSTDLYMPQGSGAATSLGDYVASSSGLNTDYSYFIEVPSGLSRLVVELFDADVGAGGSSEQDAQRDRARNAFDTTVTYSLYNPSGTLVASVDGSASSPSGADNAWISLYDSSVPAFGSVATATAGSNTTSLAVAQPAGTSAGDLLIFVLSKDGSGAINAPTGGTGGWTTVNEGACAGSACRLGVFRRFAQAGDPASYTVTWTGSEEAVGAILRYTGVDATTPIGVSGAATGTSASPTAPSVTTTVANTRIVRIYGADDDDLSGSPYPSGHSGRYNLQSSGGGGTTSSGAADAAQAAAGATGTAAFSLSATEQWRAVTLALRPAAAAAPANGHWELRVDMTGGDDLNAIGIRAHDGDSTSGGTELNIYYDSHNQFGVNPDLAANVTNIRDYDVYGWVTSGCSFSHNDFDYDSNQANNIGSVSYTSRTGAFSDSVDNNSLSTNDAWQRDTITGWTTDFLATDYGVWPVDLEIRTYLDGASGNYANLYLGNFNVGSNPPSQPMPNSFRVYLPTDAGGAPSKPYLEQLVTYVSGPNPPQVGQTTRAQVTVRLVNPAAQAVTFSTPSNLVTANVPGSGAVYAGSAQVSQGSITSQPSVGGTGNVVWNPGTVAAGATALLTYRVDVTPTSGGQRIPVTGTPASGNGTRGQYLDETGNTSQSRATYLQGPLCELALTENLLTHVLVPRFEAFVEAGSTVLEWETSSEAGTLGFLVYRLDTASGALTPVHDGILPALQDALRGGVYRLVDEAVSAGETGTYLLVELDRSGRQRLLGPYRVSPEWRPGGGAGELPDGGYGASERPPSPRATRRLAAAALEARGAGSQGSGPQGAALKVLVRGAGLYRLSSRELATGLGVSPAQVRGWIATAGLSLTHRAHPVAWWPDTDGDGLLFYGEGIDSLFTLDNVYRLEVAPGLVASKTNLGFPRPTRFEETFPETLHTEVDRFPATVLPLDPSSDYWFWEAIISGHPTWGSKSFTVSSPGAASVKGTGTLTVRLQGATDSGVPGEHRAAVRLNGVDLGETSWQGIATHVASFEVALDLLVDGPNTVEVTGLPALGSPVSVFYVDSFDLAYPRRYRAAGESLACTGGGNQVVTVPGFDDSRLWVLDLTDPLRPGLGTGFTVDTVVEGFRASFAPRSPSTPYLVVSALAIKAPAALVPDQPSDLRSPANRAEYLAIAPGALMEEAAALAAYRESLGLFTRVVDVADVMDEFNDGISSPQAIADFLRYAYLYWDVAPRFVVLIGDGSVDYRNLLGQGAGLVPPLMTTTPFGLFAADLRYGDVVGGDGVPEMAVGRIPVLTAAELAAYTAKLTLYESAPEAPESALLLADDPDESADFAVQSDDLSVPLSAFYRPVPLYLGPLPLGTLRQRMFDEIRAGTGLVSFFGHGGSLGLADEGILTAADVPSLGNAGSPLVLAAWTCAVNRFELPGLVTLGEELLLAVDGGAVAVVAPSGLAYHAEVEDLATEFVRRLEASEAPLLGEAFREAVASRVAAGASGTMLGVFNILGDPALILRLHPPVEEPGGGGGPVNGE